MIFLIFLVIKFHKTSELQTQSIRKALENELLKYNCEFSSKKGIKSDQILTCSNKEYKTERNKVIVDQTIIDKLSNPTLPTNEGVLINIKNSDFEIRSSMIEKVSTIDSEAQILSFKGDGEHTISRTKFNVVLSKDKKSIKESEIFMHNCYDPSVIIFEDYSNNLIIESEFFSNTNVKENKLYENHPMRCIRTSKSINLIVDQTHFFNATSYHQGSFVKHESEGELFIKKSYFYSCLDRSNIAHGIYTNQGPINIEYCKFDNIDTKLSTQGSIILSESKLLNFIGNKIAFKNPIISNRFLFLSKRGIFNISENKFKDYENERNNAAIFIPTASKITFNYNEFSNIISDGISHGIYLVFDRMNTTKIIGNKFQNISSSDSFFYIKAENGIEINITFDNLDLNNVHQNGGGIINIENNENKTYGLILNNCIFYDNNNNTDGGSLLINQKTYPFCKGLIVNNCEIVWNTASGRGGAIAFFNDGNVSIIDCFCNLNAAFGGGGVIYIETDSKDKRQFYISGSEFNRNYGDKSHCIWINVFSFDDDYTFECESCRFFDNNGYYEYNSEGGACCVSNCKRAVFTECIISAKNSRESCGGINITAKSILEVQNCQFNRCITGSNKESYGGGICYSLHSSDELDRSRDEDISITDCAFEENEGYNGVSLFLNVTTLNIHISNIEILNHLTSDHIFCINFNEKITNDILIMNNISFIGNSHNSKVYKDFCGGSGICFSSTKELKKLIVQFVNCNFEYNISPVNGGAFGYEMKDDQKEIDFIFDNCHFKHNLCELSGGACHFCSNNTIDIINCEFINNTSKGTKSNSGGGSIRICSSAELITIHGCKFIIKDCIFSENNAECGGAISIESTGNYEINNCIFNNNKAELSSDGKGGSILIGNCSSCIEDDPSNKNEIIIQNSIFESNEAFHGEAIYIGQHYLTDLHIMNNKFINNFDKSLEHLNSSIIESEICYDHIYHGINKEILKKKLFFKRTKR